MTARYVMRSLARQVARKVHAGYLAVRSFVEEELAAAREASLEERMARQGHTITTHLAWMIEDDSGGHAHCTCGWRSREVKAIWMYEKGMEHLRAVAAGGRVAGDAIS